MPCGVHLRMLELIVVKGRQVHKLISKYLALQPLDVHGILQSILTVVLVLLIVHTVAQYRC